MNGVIFLLSAGLGLADFQWLVSRAKTEPLPREGDLEDGFTSIKRVVFSRKAGFSNRILTEELQWLVKHPALSLEDRAEAAKEYKGDDTEDLLGFSKVKLKEEPADFQRVGKILRGFKRVGDKERIVFQFLREKTNILIRLRLRYWGMLNEEIKRHFEREMIGNREWPLVVVDGQVLVSEGRINGLAGVEPLRGPCTGLKSPASHWLHREINGDEKGKGQVVMAGGEPQSFRERLRSVFGLADSEEKRLVQILESKLDFLRYYQTGDLALPRIEAKNARLAASRVEAPAETVFTCGVLEEKTPAGRGQGLATGKGIAEVNKAILTLLNVGARRAKAAGGLGWGGGAVAGEQRESSKPRGAMKAGEGRAWGALAAWGAGIGNYACGWGNACEKEDESALGDLFRDFNWKEGVTEKKTKANKWVDSGMDQYPEDFENIYQDLEEEESVRGVMAGKNRAAPLVRTCFPLHGFDPQVFEEQLQFIEDIEIESCELRPQKSIGSAFVMPADACFLSMLPKKLFLPDTPTKLVSIVKHSFEILSETLDASEIGLRKVVGFPRITDDFSTSLISISSIMLLSSLSPNSSLAPFPPSPPSETPSSSSPPIAPTSSNPPKKSKFEHLQSKVVRPENAKLKSLRPNRQSLVFEESFAAPKPPRHQETITESSMRESWYREIREITGIEVPNQPPRPLNPALPKNKPAPPKRLLPPPPLMPKAMPHPLPNTSKLFEELREKVNGKIPIAPEINAFVPKPPKLPLPMHKRLSIVRDVAQDVQDFLELYASFTGKFQAISAKGLQSFENRGYLIINPPSTQTQSFLPSRADFSSQKVDPKKKPRVPRLKRTPSIENYLSEKSSPSLEDPNPKPESEAIGSFSPQKSDWSQLESPQRNPWQTQNVKFNLQEANMKTGFESGFILMETEAIFSFFTKNKPKVEVEVAKPKEIKKHVNHELRKLKLESRMKLFSGQQPPILKCQDF